MQLVRPDDQPTTWQECCFGGRGLWTYLTDYVFAFQSVLEILSEKSDTGGITILELINAHRDESSIQILAVRQIFIEVDAVQRPVKLFRVVAERLRRCIYFQGACLTIQNSGLIWQRDKWSTGGRILAGAGKTFFGRGAVLSRDLISKCRWNFKSWMESKKLHFD